MISRFASRDILTNDSKVYENIIFKRNLKEIRQYDTVKFPKISYEDAQQLNLQPHIWSLGDRFYKLANEYYGDSRDWWIIARFNNTPTESHIYIGQTIVIPTPLERVLILFNY